MASITLEGNPINTSGDLPVVGSTAHDFHLTTVELNDIDLADYAGKRKILNIVVSIDTGICEDSTKYFNDAVSAIDNVQVFTISADLPFALARVFEAGNIKNVLALSMMRSRNFAKDYGVLIQNGPLAGVTARAIIVLDEENKVLYTELVPEITQAPDYDKALAALS
ncbi:Thiol peroxidase, Tpx-type [hydrothermal vent metagenome]|uniref:Thiol peroxidase, Tpx-type n=1 Tax=hydrothermal vent metagenome TaxID=652676 RepID=A0A3B1ACR7_9ZZZZ